MDPANDDHDDDDDDMMMMMMMMILILIMMITLYLTSIEGVYGPLWQLYIRIQILRVLANTPTGYGYSKKLDQKIKKKHFQIAMKIFLSFKDLFVPCSVTTVNIIIKRRKRQDGSPT